MYTDMFGKKRVKLGLHQHSTRSDGKLSPEELAALYRDASYDAIAITDHWVYSEQEVLSGLPILAGAEYHVGFRNAAEGIYHILCLFADSEPVLDRETATAQGIIDAIHAVGGLAVLAHPAWSLNTLEGVRGLRGVDATEIYNTVSKNTARADASLLIDIYATNGLCFPLFAADDFHSLEGPNAIVPTAFLMVECDSTDSAALKKAITEGRFYASTGPEIHLRKEGDTVVVDCSPVERITFYTDCVISGGRVVRGEGLTTATYRLSPADTYVRAAVCDDAGREAWSHIIRL